MHLLGHNLADHKLVKVALTSFFGIGAHTSTRILARLQIHDSAPVSSLTEAQVTALSAFLSSPSTTPPPAPTPVCPPGVSVSEWNVLESEEADKLVDVQRGEAMNDLKIETDLRRQIQSDIGHHKAIGTYRGRRHASGLPVRGQRTRTNAKTARKLNRVERKHFSTSSPIFMQMQMAQATPIIPRPVLAGSTLVETLRPLLPFRFPRGNA